MHPTRPLVVVAHPHDALLGFSSVLDGADVVAVTDGAPLPDPAIARLASGFERACSAFGAHAAIRLRVETCAAIERMRALGPRDRVYAPTPLDPNPHHVDVALAAAEVFGEVLVPCATPPFEVCAVLSAEALAKKIAVANECFLGRLPDIAPPPQCEVRAADVVGIESFVRARFEDVARAVALTHYDRALVGVVDPWALEASEYERARFEHAARLLAGVAAGGEIGEVAGIGPREGPMPVRRLEGSATGEIAGTAEIGAREGSVSVRRLGGIAAGEIAQITEVGPCEGAMTVRLRGLFPAARIRAIEPSRRFAARLEARFSDDARVEVLERSAFDLDRDLDGDLVVAMEVLEHAGDRLPEVLARIRAPRLLTSYHGAFDRRLLALLEGSGWRCAGSADLPAMIERTGPFAIRRVGCTLRLFVREGAPSSAPSSP